MSKPIKDKFVLCAGCGNKIHIDHFAGVLPNDDGSELWYCDALPCLLAMDDQEKIIDKKGGV